MSERVGNVIFGKIRGFAIGLSVSRVSRVSLREDGPVFGEQRCQFAHAQLI